MFPCLAAILSTSFIAHLAVLLFIRLSLHFRFFFLAVSLGQDLQSGLDYVSKVALTP